MSILAASTASSPISRFRRRRYRRRRRGHTVEPPACPTRWTCHCVAPECVRPTRATVFRPIHPRFLPACADRHCQHSSLAPAGFVARAVRGHASDAGTPHARPLTRTRGVIHRPCRGPRRATPRVAIRRGFVCPPRLVGDGPGRRGWIGSSTGARDGRGRRRRRWDARRRGRGRRGGDARGIDDRVRSARREGCPPRCCTPR